MKSWCTFIWRSFLFSRNNSRYFFFRDNSFRNLRHFKDISFLLKLSKLFANNFETKIQHKQRQQRITNKKSTAKVSSTLQFCRNWYYSITELIPQIWMTWRFLKYLLSFCAVPYGIDSIHSFPFAFALLSSQDTRDYLELFHLDICGTTSFK